MANNKRVIQWILDKSEELNLQVLNLEWINRFFPGYFDFQVSLTIGQNIYIGRGSDIDSNTALIKAICEAIERCICDEYRISSVGAAGHIELDLAKENALSEYFERSALASHVKNKIPMKSLSTEAIEVKTKDFGLVQFDLTQFEMNVPHSYYGMFSLAHGLKLDSKLGGFMGAAVSKNRVDARIKSKIECLRNLLSLELEPIQSISYEKFKSIKSPSPADSQKLLFNADYCQNLLLIFNSSSNSTNRNDFDFNAVKFNHLNSKNLVLSSCPFVFAQCLSIDGSNLSDLEFVG